MILTMAWVGLGGYTANVLYKAKHQEELEVKKEWRLVMYRAGVHNKDENSKSDKNLQTYEIQKFIKKEYGYDLIVSIPYGMTYQKLEGIKAELETGLKGDINMHWVKDSQSAYLKVYKKIPERDNDRIKYEWNQLMDIIGIKNKENNTYKITNYTEQEKYGFDLTLNIPMGLSVNNLLDKKEIIETNLGAVVDIRWNRFEKNIIFRVANIPFDEFKAYEPIKTEPYEVYQGQTFFRENAIANLNDTPHILISGASGSGKTRCLFISVTNLVANFTENFLHLWLVQVSDKKDVQKFKDCKQTQYFAYNLQKALEMFRYIRQIIQLRNIEINKYHLDSIVDYNKKFPNKQWQYEYIIIDEFSSIMVDENKEIDIYYNVKKKCIVELQHIIKEGRSCGFFVISAIQRPDKENMPPIFKSQFSTKSSFRQNNLASAKVVTDNGECLGLPNREAIFEANDNYHIKTPFIDNNIIYKYIKPSVDMNHKYVDISKSLIDKNKMVYSLDNETDEDMNIDNTKQTSKKNKQKQGVSKNGIKL